MNTDVIISVVIPVLGDLKALAEILDRLRSAAGRPDEIIVVDGANDTDCAELCAHYDCVYLSTSPGRGHQLDAGARRASGDVIWFLHADCRPPTSAVDRIRSEISDGAIGGYFRFQFTGKTTWYKRLLAWLINQRSRIGIPYGDQGLFIRRSRYADIGGFPDTPLFEEVSLVKAARRNGRFVQLAVPMGVSPRRWERDGWIRRTLANRMLALGYTAGISPATLARHYQSGQSSASE
jgi:rSAM/selenodomain-associated transferase 2